MPKDQKLDSLFRDILNFRPRVKDLRRTQVITAVIDLISEKGIDEVTFESVGKKVGMARSHVVYYFKDRNEMIESAVKFVAFSAQHIISEKLQEEKDWKVLLSKYVHANFDWMKNYPNHSSVMWLLYYQASFKKKYKEFHSDIRETGAKRVEAILRMSPASKKLSTQKMKSVARAVQSLITGNLIEATSTGKKSYSKLRSETVEVSQDLIESYL